MSQFKSCMHAELAVTKNVNNLLLTRLTRYFGETVPGKFPIFKTRRECLDTMGILCKVSGEALEEKVLAKYLWKTWLQYFS